MCVECGVHVCVRVGVLVDEGRREGRVMRLSSSFLMDPTPCLGEVCLGLKIGLPLIHPTLPVSPPCKVSTSFPSQTLHSF